MTTERDPDPEATVEMPRPIPQVDEELEDVDPEQTLVREDLPQQDAGAQKDADDSADDWESTVIRRIASHVVAVRDEVEEDPEGEDRFGWESAGLRRLSREVLGGSG